MLRDKIRVQVYIRTHVKGWEGKRKREGGREGGREEMEGRYE